MKLDVSQRIVGCVAVLVTPLLLGASCGGAPEAVESRPELPSCGRYAVEEQTAAERAEIKEKGGCMLDALSRGRPAELIATEPTEEGAPVTTYFRVLGKDRVETFTDASEDPNASPPRWYHYECTGLELHDSPSPLEATGCKSIPLVPALRPGDGAKG